MGGSMNTLIEELRKFRDEYRRCIHPDNCSDRGADLIDDCVAIAMKHSDWIPVSERLPSDDGDFLVCATEHDTGYQYQSVAYFNSNRWLDSDGVINFVTHWQPLPQPPSEVQP